MTSRNVVIDENVTIGNPLELFREIERIYRRAFKSPVISEPNLSSTPIGGVSKFFGIASGYVTGAVLSWGIIAVGCFLTLIGAVGIVAYFDSLPLVQPYGIITLLVAAALAIIGIGVMSQANQLKSGAIECSLKGESYDARALGLRSERAAVFSRATLILQWKLAEGTDAIPSRLEEAIIDKIQDVREDIDQLLPRFTEDKIELPDTKS